MSFKNILVFCTQALLIQSISSQWIDTISAPLAGASCGAWGAPYGAAEWVQAPAASLSASKGPGVAVSTASPLIPAGVSVLSNNAYEGTLAVGGALPFLGTVALEGVLPTAGAGAVSYKCGNGAIGITAEDSIALGYPGIAGPLGYEGGFAAPLGFEAGLAGPLAYDAGFVGSLGYEAGIVGPLGYEAGLVGPLGYEAGFVGPLGYEAGLAGPLGVGPALAAPTGIVEQGVLAVSTSSPLVPTGVSVLSENVYEGALAVGGAMPFLGTVALEGALPTAGAGAITYGCGNGAVGITAEDIDAVGIAGINRPFGFGAAPFGIARPGCGMY